MTVTREQRDELRRWLEGVSPGSWEVVHDGTGKSGMSICRVSYGEPDDEGVRPYDFGWMSPVVAHLVAAAVNALGSLLDAADRAEERAVLYAMAEETSAALRAERDRLREEVERLRPFLRHRVGCASGEPGRDWACNCGLDDARAAAERKEP